MDRRLPAFLSLFALFSSVLFAGGGAERKLTIYYTSSLNGNLDGCTCKAAPKAGLVKRAVFLRGLRDRSRAVLVDLGDILGTDGDELLSEAVLSTYSQLGYDAVSVGDQETSDGLEDLTAYHARFPLLSNNLSVCVGDACTLLSPAPLTLERDGLSVGVAALIDPEVFALYPKELKTALKISPCVEAAQAMLGHLKEERVDVRILLYHGPLDNAVELAGKVQGFDVVLAGHEQRLYEARRFGSTIVASPGEEGNRVGVMELRVDDKGVAGFRNEFRLFDYMKDPDDPETRARIEDYYGTMRARLKENKG
jgi:2',3'-cyclic-nucleotide 2'-phosphodiesterase (5'-nucleotidase family)